jgi:hypothetical protein
MCSPSGNIWQLFGCICKLKYKTNNGKCQEKKRSLLKIEKENQKVSGTLKYRRGKR